MPPRALQAAWRLFSISAAHGTAERVACIFRLHSVLVQEQDCIHIFGFLLRTSRRNVVG
jgi:hypothetical protein